MAPTTPKTKSSKQSSPRSPKFSWLKKHRQALLVLHRRRMTDEQITAVFNKLFKNDIRAKGIPGGLTKSTINAQFNRSYRNSCQAWQEVEASQDSELEWVSKEMETFNIASMPSKPLFDTPSTLPFTNSTSLKAPRRSTTTVSVVIPVMPKTNNIVSTHPPRNIFNKSPRSMVSATRTRTVGGAQVPIIRATDSDLVINHPITPAEAHSAVPELLFRFYDDNSQGVRTKEGEISGRHAYLPCGPPAPPPCADDRVFAAVLCHLNTDETASELISTTSNLFFAMRLAAKSNANPRICVIRGSAMPSRKIFHLWPYHIRFLADKLYYNGKYINPSSHEYAVWATIPVTAVLCDFDFKDLEQNLVRNPEMRAVFRINEMRTRKGNTHILKDFRKEKLDLTLSLAEGLAKLMPQFGVTAMAPGAVIARLVSEVIRGFKIDLHKTSPARWQMLAGAFAYALTDHANQRNIEEIRLVRIQEAFLSGVRIGIGELNWHLNAQKQARMLRKGTQLGLGGQSMLAEEIDTSYHRRIVRNNQQMMSARQRIDARRIDGRRFDDEEAETDIEEDNDEDVDRHAINEDSSDEQTTNSGMVDKIAPLEDIVYEDDIVEYQIDRDTISVAIPGMTRANELGDADEDTTIEEEEAETDIEEEIEDKIEAVNSRGVVNSHFSTSRRISHPREVTRYSKKIPADIIILDDSDDEDFFMC